MDKYRNDITKLESALADYVNKGFEQKDLDTIQEKLDIAANEHQHNEALGASRYKLYEIQALVHYYAGNDQEAITYAEDAAMAYGSKYDKVDYLISTIEGDIKNTYKEDAVKRNILNSSLSPLQLIATGLIFFLGGSLIVKLSFVIAVGVVGAGLFALAAGLIGGISSFIKWLSRL